MKMDGGEKNEKGGHCIEMESTTQKMNTNKVMHLGRNVSWTRSLNLN